MSLDTFVSSKDTFTISPSLRLKSRIPLSPKRKLRENSTSFSPKRKISIERKVEKENKEYKRPQAPMRPVPHMPPKISIVKPEQKNEDEIEAKFSISKALEQPLYLSSARILNTPENSSEESFESREDILKLKSPIQSQEDTKLRLSITRSEGGIGTSIPREFFDSVESQDMNKVDSPIPTPIQNKAKEDSATTVRTSSVIDALRIQTSDRGTSSCTVCGVPHNPRHSRVCIMCFRPMCKQCKKRDMVKLAKKSWVCQACVSCVKIEFPIQDDLCSQCSVPKCRRSRSCVLCKKHFCEVCKKEHMLKLGSTKWICHKHSMKEAFLNLKQKVSDN